MISRKRFLKSRLYFIVFRSNLCFKLVKLIGRLFRGNREERENKRKGLEVVIAEGVDLRSKIREQIKHSPVLRHEYVDGYRIGVEQWYLKVEYFLTKMFDTRMVASKFRSTLSLELTSFESPRVKLIDTRDDEQRLAELDGQIKNGIDELDKILKKYIKDNPIEDPILLKLAKKGSLLYVLVKISMWAIYKLLGVDLRGWLELPFG